RLPGLALGFGTRGQVARSEGVSERGFRNGLFRRRLPGWLSGQVSYSEGFRRRFRRRLRKGHSEGIRQGFGTTPKEFRDTRRAPKGFERRLRHVSKRVFEKGFREEAAGWLSKGVFEGGCEGVFRKGASGWLSKGL